MLTIPEFYSGKTVFLTGGSGFVGKVLIEKLLRCCPKIKKIYILLRPKRGQSLEERLKTITDLPLFDMVRHQNAHFLKKLQPVDGNVGELKLGLSPQDRLKLINEVDIVFHIAASVRFDDTLKHAVILNVRGTREVATLVLEIKNLQVFIHVSTTYCNCDRSCSEEKLYPARADWRQTLKIVENAEDTILGPLTQKYIHPHPNTYTFSKQLAEHVVYDLCNGKVPSIIYRPSIIVASAFGPVPGWIDNFNGPIGLLIACAKGIVRVNYADPDMVTDYIPVDITVRAMVAATWKQIVLSDESEKCSLAVYNGSNNDIQPITIKNLMELGQVICSEIPLNNILWYPNTEVTKCYYNYFIKVLLYHVLPALLVDGLLKMFGKKPMLLKIQRRIYVATMALSYFMFRQWKFNNDKALALQRKLHKDDIEEFSYKEDEVEPYEYFKTSTNAGKKYLLKETDEDSKNAKIHSQRMKILDRIVTALWYLGLFWLIFIKLNIVSIIFNKLNGYYLYLVED